MDAGDRADGEALGFEHGALFDVQLDVGMGHDHRARERTGVADAIEFGAKVGAVVADHVAGGFDGHATDVDERAEHVGRVAGAFFVGEEGDGDRPVWSYAAFDETLDHLESGEHAVRAVVAAAGLDGVDVAAAHHR